MPAKLHKHFYPKPLSFPCKWEKFHFCNTAQCLPDMICKPVWAKFYFSRQWLQSCKSIQQIILIDRKQYSMYLLCNRVNIINVLASERVQKWEPRILYTALSHNITACIYDSLSNCLLCFAKRENYRAIIPTKGSCRVLMPMHVLLICITQPKCDYYNSTA